jgi:DNA polymerase-3 subunit delta
VISLFVGQDDYLLRRALQALRDRLAKGDLGALESNTTILEGKSVTPGELMAHATAVPFLADARLVLVEGLVRTLARERKGGRKPAKAKKPDDDPLEAWRATLMQLQAALPPTTELVFIDPDASSTSEAYKLFATVCKVERFAVPEEKEVPAIVGELARLRELDIDRGALVVLGTTLPPDRWVIDMEIEKLAVYAMGETVTTEMVSDVVSAARDAKIWDFTDALLDGEERKALTAARKMLGEGNHPQVMLAVIATQVRRLAIAKELVDEQRGVADVQAALGAREYPAKKAMERSRRFSWDDLRMMQRHVLDADLSVKRGLRDDETALQLAIHSIVAVARVRNSTGARPTAMARGRR